MTRQVVSHSDFSVICLVVHTEHASMSLAAGFVSLFAVLRDYKLRDRLFMGSFALDPHSTLMWS